MPQAADVEGLLGRGTTQFILLAKVTATADRGGDILRVALHTRDIEFETETYKAVPFKVSEAQVVSGTRVNNATFQTMLADAFNRMNLKGGKWQGATVEIVVVDYEEIGEGYVRKQRGRFGEARVKGREATIEYRGLTHLINQPIGDKYSILCRYDLGDAKCTKDLTAFTHAGTVSSITNQQKFVISVNQANGYFKPGKIVWTSGNNSGLSMEVVDNVGTTITLFQPMVEEIEVGDGFNIIAGCDKKLSTCHTKFDNGINHGGEDSMPERDQLWTFPD